MKLPGNWKGEIEGFIDGLRSGCFDLPRQIHTHAYLCRDGQFRTKEQGYELPSVDSPKTLVSDGCVLVWADKPSMLWFACDKAQAAIDASVATFDKNDWRTTLG